MSQETVLILRSSLDDVDRIRKRQIAAFALLFCALSASLVWLGHMGGNPATDLRAMLLWSVITVVVAVVYAALGLALFINGFATKKILKTMELLWRD